MYHHEREHLCNPCFVARKYLCCGNSHKRDAGCLGLCWARQFRVTTCILVIHLKNSYLDLKLISGEYRFIGSSIKLFNFPMISSNPMKGLCTSISGMTSRRR